MNELSRLAYLQAMGTDTYISLRQLPGAALTRRLAIVGKPGMAASGVIATGGASAPVQPLELSPSAALSRALSAPAVNPASVEALAASTDVSPPQAHLPPRFSLAAIACNGWLWLEELEGVPLSAGQVQLVQAMAVALRLMASGGSGPADAGPGVSQFDWPIHTNRQLDLGREAARSSAAGFIRRKLEQQACRGLVLLGASCETRVAVGQLDCARLARTVSTAEMLRDPLLKKQAWRDLRPFIQSA